MRWKRVGYKYHIHTYLFSQRLDQDLEWILDKAKEAGYDGIEVPFNLEEYVPWDRLPGQLASRGLQCTTCAGIPKNSDLISADAEERRRGLDSIKRYIDRSRQLNSPVIGAD
jgi:sugar phosphate isomerase/epimerase